MLLELPEELKAPTVELLLACADDKLVLGHGNSEWTGLAPMLEEDIAFSSLAQDEIAHAQAIYRLAGSVCGRDADHLAFGRGTDEYRCAAIVELPDEFDWAFAITRRLLCDHYDLLRLGRMARSSWQPLKDLATRLAAEQKVHVEHSDAWIPRLGRGGDESRQRLQDALDRLAPIAPGLFETIEGQAELEAAGVFPADDSTGFDAWAASVTTIVNDAGLTVSLRPPDGEPGGRRGHHTEHLDALLTEMSEVFRLAPDAAW